MTQVSLAHKCTNIWKMLCEASLTLEINKTNTNQFVLKTFFCIIHLLVKQNWTLTHNFKNVNVVAGCDGKELQIHLLTASKNATYILHVYVAKYIDIMTLKAPLVVSLRKGKYTLHNGKTQGISSNEQMAIYAAFGHRNPILEHYIVILQISELVRSQLSAPTIFGALNKYLQQMNISHGRFFAWTLLTKILVSSLV